VLVLALLLLRWDKENGGGTISGIFLILGGILFIGHIVGFLIHTVQYYLG
jgi:hypothetical protein